MINKKSVFLLSVLALMFMTACSDDDTTTIYGNWIEDVQFDNDKRSDAVSFVIDETVYFGLGYNSGRTSGNYFTDISSYKKGNSSWDYTSFDDFPGQGRMGAASFAVDDKGYVVGGYNNDTADIYFAEVWQFDPKADSSFQWKRLADFPGGMRTQATAFVVGGKAYVVGGRYDADVTKKDCWQFDSATGTFTAKDGMGKKRSGAFSFVIDSMAYVGGGADNSFVKEFEVFDATTETWNEVPLKDLYLPQTIVDDISHYDDPLNLTRINAAAFVIKGKGYIMGGNNGSILRDCWEYDPTTDLWTDMNDFEGGAREKATAFVLDDMAYIMAGYYGSGYLDDMWMFEPEAEADETD